MSAPATGQPLKLEVGKAYRTRDGRRAVILEKCPSSTRHFADFLGGVYGCIASKSWRADGRYWGLSEDDCDLIAEWDAPTPAADAPEPGTPASEELKATPLAQAGVAPAASSGDQIGVTFTGESARRAIACWNACRGVSTEQLPDDLLKRLLGALENIAAHPGPPGSSAEDLGTYDQVAEDYCRRIAIARTALALFKPSTEAA